MSVQSGFCHLHVHSEYSLLDGIIKVKNLIKAVQNQGGTFCALTDHDGLHGALEFYLECQKAGIKGIIGYEANVAPWHSNLPQKPYHLILLAENNTGYKNLIKICTFANTQGKNLLGPETVSIDWDTIGAFHEGLICLTSCMKGELSQHVLNKDNSSALHFIDHLKRVFGKENVYIELIDNGLPGQSELVDRLIELSEQTSTPPVATADVHYLTPQDRDNHLSLLAIKHKLQRSALQALPLGVHFHLATPEEMRQKFSKYPKALENTLHIAQRCNVDINTKNVYMPDLQLRENEPANKCLERLAWEGLEKRKETISWSRNGNLPEEVWNDYRARLQYELDVINKMNFAGYFLIVQDFINWAKSKSIPVGPGRGSAAGSLVTYALRITDIDPIRFNLLFERFLNPERVSMPDIDTDFCQERRDEVLMYVYERYGRRNVAQIVTFGRLMAKNALKSLARITGWNFFDSNEFAKLIPESPGISLKDALAMEDRIKERLEKDERARNLWAGAEKIEGTLNSLGVHAAGVIISDRPLDEHCPLMESDGQILTQFENKYAEKAGLIKFDFLGLKTLTVIEKAIQLIRLNHNPNFSMENLDLDDPKVYELISSAHVTGIFQLESGGMRKLISELKPSCFSDIVAVLALFRPGPLGSGMVEDFVLRKHGKTKVEYLLPQLEPILSDTYGVIVFQEQVQKIAAVLAGYSLGEADLLRRAMGKKDKLEMEKQKTRFISGAISHGVEESKASEIFDLMAMFAEYGFNKSHTAAYGWVTFQTAYLKTWFPTEFMTAIMSCDLDNTDKIVTYVRDCRRMGITILPPCVNHSVFEFSIPKDNCIRFGLGAIKGLGQGVIELIECNRKQFGPFSTVPEFIARIGSQKVNKKIMDSLVKAGAFDSIASNRCEVLANCDKWMKVLVQESDLAQNSKGMGIFGQGVFNAHAVNDPIHTPLESEIPPNLSSVGYNPLKIPTGLKPSPDVANVSSMLLSIQLKNCEPWTFVEHLHWESQTLGFTLSGHKADLYREDILYFTQSKLHQVHLLLESDDIPDHKRKSHKLAGVITAIFEKRTKDNSRFCVFRLEDGFGELEIVVFPKQFVAIDPPLQVGNAIWVECKIKKGIEEGSCRGVCQALGSLEGLRQKAATRVILSGKENLLSDSKKILQLTDLLKENPGQTPVRLCLNLGHFQKTIIVENFTPPVAASDTLFQTIQTRWPGLLEVKANYENYHVEQ